MIEVGNNTQDFEEFQGDQVTFKKEPRINVVSKEVYEDRVKKVFHLLWKTLSKSFGPYGAPTIIYNYPYSHVTKDGYTIMKNISMDASETLLDQSICNMMEDVCGRLNYSVGDGTTSAVIATNSIYNQYELNKEYLQETFTLPRDIISIYNNLKEEIGKRLKEKVIPVRSQDKEELKENIGKVVYISSNGDQIITDYIATLYGELGAPAVSCELDPEGETKMTLIEGYKYPMMVNDKIYINNDDKTCEVRNVDIVIFSTRITLEIYNSILKPLNLESRTRNRRLVVAATSYDDNALTTIANELNNEFNKRKEVNMILTTYRAINSHTRKLAGDFAMLAGTTIIDRAMCDNIINQLQAGLQIWNIFNMDGRDIEGLRCIALRDKMDPNNPNQENAALFAKGVDELPEGFSPLIDSFEMVEDSINVGYCGYAKLGLKDSLFQGFFYNEERYNAHIKDAKDDLAEKEKKYQKLGTFNLEVAQAQERLYSLQLKTGIIGVGGDSELSQKLLKDAVDDSVKAAASAFNYGVVLGCNVNLIQVIQDIYNETTDEVTRILLEILLKGFKDVYRTVLSNAFDDVIIDNLEDFALANGTSEEETENYAVKAVKEAFDGLPKVDTDELFYQTGIFTEIVKKLCVKTGKVSIHDIIIEYSIATNQVFDVSRFVYSSDVVNSSQTDEEILKATIDLVSLLIVGNQMVITGRNNF